VCRGLLPEQALAAGIARALAHRVSQSSKPNRSTLAAEIELERRPFILLPSATLSQRLSYRPVQHPDASVPGGLALRNP